MHWTPAVLALPEEQVVPLLVDVLPLLDALAAPVPLLLEALLPPVVPPPVAVKLTPPPQAAKARQSAPAATRVDDRWFMVSFLGATPRPSPPMATDRANDHEKRPCGIADLGGRARGRMWSLA